VRRYPSGTPLCRRPSRSISTCAEVPHAPSPWMLSQRVYLHVCGGTLFRAFISSSTVGLSPRVRRYPRRGRG